jgi:hypothetical protein
MKNLFLSLIKLTLIASFIVTIVSFIGLYTNVFRHDPPKAENKDHI